LYRKIFQEEAQVQFFLTHICDSQWNEQQDAGRPLAEATQILVAQFPEYTEAIQAYYGRWTEMLGGPIRGTVQLLEALHQQKKYRLYALTNWSHETFPYALQHYDFLQLFDGILVSGEEKLVKPDPRIYQLLFERFDINPSTALFIDDNPKNVLASRQSGMEALQFVSPEQLQAALSDMGIHR
ncbi:MAG: HAD family hydrolase, partial [Haliscomenobacter sp.]